VFLAYVTARAHALMDFMLYLPKAWIGDPQRRTRVQVPDKTAVATKPQLAVDLIGRAVTAAVPFAWGGGRRSLRTGRQAARLCGVIGQGLRVNRADQLHRDLTSSRCGASSPTGTTISTPPERPTANS
jgi:hypothetical protein